MIREANVNDAPAIARVHVDAWRTTYRGILPESFLANLSYAQREKNWIQILSTAVKDNHFVYIVETVTGQIVAFAAGGAERTGNSTYKGELYAIYILNSYQRKGIGRRLILSVVEKLHSLGFNSMLVWVLVDNPACSFYETLGGQKVYEKPIEIGGVTLKEVAYIK